MNKIEQFLGGIRQHVFAQDGDNLRRWLQVEPSAVGPYYQLAEELGRSFPSDAVIERSLPISDDVVEGTGSSWPGFNSFIKEYLQYWRDVEFRNVIHWHARLSELLISCANALANPTYGSMLLQTSISLSESLAKLVMVINKKPELLAQIQGSMGSDESSERKSVVEVAADIIQKIFTSCLTDRSSGRFQPPLGKKVAVYTFANLTLKLLFACDKSRLAVQMFTNLSTSGPALSLYPASQRVTFLYYLGRFNFDHEDFYRAHMCFEEAYRQCPPAFQKHRRQILTYWIPANLLLGRFPSQSLLSRPEAAGFADIFLPICLAIRAGNFVAFYGALKGPHRDWLWDRGLYLVFLYRLKPLVWRSFTRRTFMLTWRGINNATAGGANNNTNVAASLSLDDLVTTATFVQKLLEGYVPASSLPRERPPHTNTIFLKAGTNNNAAADDVNSTLVAPPTGPKRLMPTDGLIFGNKRPDVDNMESIVAGLVYSGLLNGFIARQQRRFAVEGAKKKGGDAVAAGWPNVYASIMDRLREQHAEALEAADAGEAVEPPGEFDDVPGWVRGP